MKVKDKRNVEQYRKAYPASCAGVSNKDILSLIKSIFNGRKDKNKQFSRLVKRA